MHPLRSVPTWLLALFLLSGAAGCRGKSSSPRPEKGFVQAKVIAAEAELIGGPRAEGRVGDFLLANDRIRVIVGAAADAPGFNLYGGSILDADVVRAAGVAGFDLFGEAFPSGNVITLAADPVVEVVEAGCAAPGAPSPCEVRRASVRVSGTGFQFPLFPNVPGLTNPVEADLETTYTLEAGAASVLVETKVTMREAEETLVQCFDVLLFGTGLEPFGRPVGAGDTGELEWFGGDASRVIGGVHQRVGYGWLALAPSATMDIPFSDAAQQLAMMGELSIEPGKAKTFRRRFIVGEDLGQVASEVARVRGKSVGTFSGIVNDSVGSPVADAFVTVRTKGVDEDENGQDDFVARARSDAGGAFTVSLPAGTYEASVAAPGGTGDPIEVPVKKGKLSQAVFVVPATGTLLATPTDASDGSPMPAKVTLVDGSGSVVARGHYGGTSERTIAAPPGTYTAFVSRGPEWEVKQSSVVLTAGGVVTLDDEAALDRVVSTPGFVSGDYHLHTVQSRDSGVTLEERALSLAVEGLEYVALTDHERVQSLTPAIETQGLSAFLNALPGDEVSIPLYGHFNAYPMPESAIATREHDGTRFWFDTIENRQLTAAELLTKLRAIPGERIVQMNHPRSAGKGYLDTIHYDPLTGLGDETLPSDFDTIEVNGEIDIAEDSTILDWFSMLKQGMGVTAVGVSDSHEIWDPGYPRTLVGVGTDDPAQVTEAAFIDAMRAGRVTVSSGPFVVTSASTPSASAGLGGTLDASAGGAITLDVHVESPAWAPFDTIRVYENGSLFATRAVTPTLALGRFVHDEPVTLTPAADAFYVVVVTGPGSLQPIGSGGIYAYTNPVFVDLAGDGWAPPGL